MGSQELRRKYRSMRGYSRHRQQIQVDVIRNTFARRGIAVRVETAPVDPGYTRFVVEGAGKVPDARALEKALRHNLSCDRLRSCWRQGRLLLDIPSLPEASVNLLDLLETIPLPPYVAALGWSEDGRPVLLNFAGEDTGHVLLRGDAYAGKSSLMRTCAVSLAMGSRQSQIQMVFIDPRYRRDKGSPTNLGALQYLPHALERPVSTGERIAQLLAFLADEMRHRRRHGVKEPRIVVFVDRSGALLRRGGATIEEPLRLLLGQGTSCGIHVVMSARASTGRDLDHLVALGPQLRIHGWSNRSEAGGARLMRQPHFTHELLGKGDFVATHGDDAVRFQAAYLSEYDLHYCLESLQRRRPPPILARPTRARLTLPTGARPGLNSLRAMCRTPMASTVPLP